MDDIVACPRCEKGDKVEHVPVIVAEAFPTLQTAEYTLPRRWAGRMWFTPLPDFKDIQHQLDTPLKLLPAAPRPPEQSRQTDATSTKENMADALNRSLIRIALMFIATVAATIVFMGLNIAVLVILSTIVAMILFLALGMFYVAQKLMRKLPQGMLPLTADYKRAHVREAEARWERLYYCYRDEGVFERGDDFVPLADMEKFLYTGTIS